MSKTNKGLYSLIVPLLAFLLFFMGCEENPGSVGNDYVDKPELVFDTLSVSELQELHFSAYGGQLTYLPAGFYADPVFGEVESIGMLKPNRMPSIPDSIDFGAYTIHLQVALDSTLVYGDTLSETQFTLYPILNRWRGNAFRIDEELDYDENNPVASFSITDEKLLQTESLDETWVDSYETASTDTNSNYADFYGLAMVADNGTSSKIVYPVADDVQFYIINEAKTDTFTVGLHSSAYSLKRGNTVDDPETVPLYGTLENVAQLSIPFQQIRDQLSNKNLVQAEILVTEAKTKAQGNRGDSEHLPPVNNLLFDIADDSESVYEYQFGVDRRIDRDVFLGQRDEDTENLFRADITGYINNVIYGSNDQNDLILGLEGSSGAIRSTLIYGQNAPDSLAPKLIFTTLADE